MVWHDTKLWSLLCMWIKTNICKVRIKGIFTGGHKKKITTAYYEQNEVFIGYISSKFFFLKLYTEVPEFPCMPMKPKWST